MKSLPKYEHIFIDLDKTLWDFETNARETFTEIFHKYQLTEKGIEGLDRFLEVYTGHNDMLWALYRENRIKKEILNVQRFRMTLESFGIKDETLPLHIADDYVTLSPMKNNLFPGAVKTLEILVKRGYSLHIITNGFEEVQQAKLDHSDLRRFFKTITTSEEAGVKKPALRIFHLALEKASALPEKSIMIGDDPEVDLTGARGAGMDQLFFNPAKLGHNGGITMEASSWKEIAGYF